MRESVIGSGFFVDFPGVGIFSDDLCAMSNEQSPAKHNWLTLCSRLLLIADGSLLVAHGSLLTARAMFNVFGNTHDSIV